MRQIIIKLSAILSHFIEERTLLHLPHGVTPWIFTLLPDGATLAAIWSVAFLIYELNTDRHKKDGAWRDIYGFLVGLVIGAVIRAILYIGFGI